MPPRRRPKGSPNSTRADTFRAELLAGLDRWVAAGPPPNDDASSEDVLRRHQAARDRGMALLSYTGGHRAEISLSRRDAIMEAFDKALAATLAAALFVHPDASITDAWYEDVVDALVDALKLAHPLP
jgi:hypothetical protein